MNRMVKGVASSLLVVAMGFGTVGCETKAQTGALAGGAGGAAVGAGIGSFSGNAGKGALIGGAVGAIGGYIVGNEMDKKDQRERDRGSAGATRAPAEETREAAPAPAATGGRVGKAEVLKWADAGTKDEIIIDRIQRTGSVRLSPQDESELRDAGVSEDVVRAMKDSAR